MKFYVKSSLLLFLLGIFFVTGEARRNCGLTCTGRKCCRVRKDFTSMTTVERRRFVNAFKRASTVEPYKTKFNRLVQQHITLFPTIIHNQAEFLPWHRWYLIQIENILREVDCRVNLPYWDWSLWAHDPWNTAHGIWRSDGAGLGGNGTGINGCVQTGVFREGSWNVIPGARVDGISCLRREFNGVFLDAVAVSEVLNISPSDFATFEIALRENLHDSTHCFIGGHMCTSEASAAPEFFLHHGFVDKIWYDWQKKSSQHLNAFFHGKTTTLRGTNAQITQMVNSASLQYGVCVVYKDPTHDRCNTVVTSLHGLCEQSLEAIPRLLPSCFPQSAVRLFHISKTDMAKVNRIQNKITPKKVIAPGQLQGFENSLGFKVPAAARRDEANGEHWNALSDSVLLEEDDDEDDEDDDDMDADDEDIDNEVDDADDEDTEDSEDEEKEQDDEEKEQDDEENDSEDEKRDDEDDEAVSRNRSFHDLIDDYKTESAKYGHVSS